MIVETWGVYVAALVVFTSSVHMNRNPPLTSTCPEVVYFVNGTSVGIFQNATILRILRILRRCAAVLGSIQVYSSATGCCERPAWRSFCARCLSLCFLLKAMDSTGHAVELELNGCAGIVVATRSVFFTLALLAIIIYVL